MKRRRTGRSSTIVAAFHRSARLFVAIFVLASSSCGWAQASPSSTPSPRFQNYDVISIKPNKSGSGSTHIDSYETTFKAQNVSLKMLLSSAYGVRENVISGLPPWAQSSRWDINAKIVEPDPGLKDRKMSLEESTAEYRGHVLFLLTERFHLKAHEETATGAIFDLVVAKGGSKLQPASAADKEKGSMHTHNMTLTATGVDLFNLTQFLGGQVERNVVDKTGLTGEFNAVLKWSKDDQAVTGSENGLADKPPTLFTAIEEQWGLKLVADKGPVTTLVVDSIDMPVLD